MAKRIMRAFKMSEVSAVDRPCQEGARIVIMKRAEDAGFNYPSDIAKKEFSDDKRKELAGTGAALPDGSFPIENKGDLANAIKAYGRAADKAKAKAHIISRAKTLGASDMIPDDWTKRAPRPGATWGDWSKRALLVAKDDNGDGDATLFDDTVDAAESDEDAETYARAMCEEIDEATCALADSIRSILDDDEVTDKQAMLEQTFEQYKTHVQDIVPEEMEKALATARAAVSKAKESTDMTQDEFKKAVADAVTIEVKKAADAQQSVIDKLTAENALLKLSDKHKSYMDSADMSDAEKAKFLAKKPDERDAHMADNPAEKRLPPHIQKALAEGEEMRKRLTALENDKALVELSKRAAAAGLPLDFGAVLQRAEGGDKEAISKLLEKYAEANKAREAALKSGGIFTEFGTSRGSSAGAYDQLIAKRDELRKGDMTLTLEQAFAKVMADPSNRELVEQERRERMAKISGGVAA